METAKPKRTLAENIRDDRQKAKLDPKDAAAKAGIAWQSWYAYENGSRLPTLEALKKIAAVLKTTVARLHRGI